MHAFKRKTGESAFGITFKYKINLMLWSTSDFFHLFWRKMWTNSLFILRKLLKVWLRPMNTGPYFYRMPWQGKPGKQVQIMKNFKAILKAYESVTEVYRQKCRSCRKRDDKLMLTLPVKKELLLEKELTSTEVTTHFH